MSYRRFLAVLLSTLTVFGTAAVATPSYAWGPPVGPYHIVNRHSGLCLSIYLGSKVNGAPAVQVPCDDNYPVSRSWYTPSFHLENARSYRCLKVTGDSMADDAVAVQKTCEGVYPHTENWLPIDLNPFDDWVHLVNEHTGKCLTVYNASTVINAGIVQVTCDFSYPFNEEWVLRKV